MKCIIIICFVLSVTLATILSQDAVLGNKLEQVSLARTFTPGACGGGQTSVCTSCTTLSVCISANDVIDVPCNSTTNAYCQPGDVEASCSTEPATGCAAPSDETVAITCSSVGMLPDPSNCNIYHVCRAVQGISDVYQCPAGTRFNLSVLQCRTQSVSPCVTVTCGATSGFVYYGTSRQYYAYCSVANGVTNRYIFKCPNRATFNMATNSCVYVCAGVGNYVNTNDPATYYQCYVANGRYVAALRQCPVGTSTFNQTLQYCV
ncbi:AAEL012650-PA [Aedes aegypti]|uniref:AAEL012650-PA n=1 Tax=Aedes aegypti TaxID=7159 RepID=Q16LI2_AEDAE|nr:AAEL012650-PA [Aedes aegypti]